MSWLTVVLIGLTCFAAGFAARHASGEKRGLALPSEVVPNARLRVEVSSGPDGLSVSEGVESRPNAKRIRVFRQVVCRNPLCVAAWEEETEDPRELRFALAAYESTRGRSK